MTISGVRGGITGVNTNQPTPATPPPEARLNVTPVTPPAEVPPKAEVVPEVQDAARSRASVADAANRTRLEGMLPPDGKTTPVKRGQAPSPTFDQVRAGEALVQKNHVGPEVRTLQTKLNDLGAKPALKVDGEFGGGVESAVKKYQDSRALKPTGVVDAKTLQALESNAPVVDKTYVEGPRPPAQEPPTGTAPSGKEVLGPQAKPLGVKEHTGGGDFLANRTPDGNVGAYTFRAKLHIDSDGAPNVTKDAATAKKEGLLHDPHWQAGTSLRWADNKAVNSDRIPYVVLPPDVAKATGTQPGDLVKVQRGDRSCYAIFADSGPSTKIGEGSMALARTLGINDHPGKGGIDAAEVQYTVLPRSGDQAGIWMGSRSKTLDDIQRLGREAFENARKAGLVQ
jgi:peptidoglycan hydrolase-like protein with peptidoglycan-binding domain